MTKVRWLGEKDGPEEIDQYGIHFVKGEWTDVPTDEDEDKAHQERGGLGFNRMAKFKGNRFFEVQGVKPAPEGSGVTSTPPATQGIARAPLTTYTVTGDKKNGFYVVDSNGAKVDGNKPAYATAEDAQHVADALNSKR